MELMLDMIGYVGYNTGLLGDIPSLQALIALAKALPGSQQDEERKTGL